MGPSCDSINLVSLGHVEERRLSPATDPQYERATKVLNPFQIAAGLFSRYRCTPLCSVKGWAASLPLWHIPHGFGGRPLGTPREAA